MKKILFSIGFIALAAVAQLSYGQVCSPGAISRWTGTNQPGDHFGITQAPIVINGLSNDWEANITGPYAYAGTPRGGYEGTPYAAPIAGANVQVDGLRAAVAPDYDRDCVGQDHRDLRYFAFTYDIKNVYFIFRRPKNNTAQVTLYYFIDINVDGWMAQGEPIIQVTFNNSGADIAMGYYHPVNTNGSIPGSYDAVKGNVMTAPMVQVKNCNTSDEWAVGSADGWSMPGDFVGLKNNVTLPATVAPEVFAAATITDTHPDGTEPGYGVEFAVPWKYLGLYTEAGLTPNTAINSGNVFTWHVSLVSGNSGVSGAEDNAGGCCSGLAFSNNANSVLTQPVSVTELTWQEKFRNKLTYTENVGYSTNVILGQVSIKNIVTAGAIAPDPTTQYTVTVFPADAGGNPIGLGTIFAYSSVTAGEYFFVGGPVISTASAGGTAKFVVDVDFGPLKRTKSATITYETSNEFNVPSNNCEQQGSTTNNDINILVTTLPVTFKTFTAVRSNSNVLLKWETATEVNNTGFAIERNINGTWQQIAWVPSQAAGGNSTTDLVYTYNDLNNNKGISQYRIKQVDFDAKSAYSIVRAVRADGALGKVVMYPNPTTDGKINVVFDDATESRDVSVMDMSGRIVKQIRNITNNNITIENLTPGIYSVRVLVPATGEQVVQKIVVNKR